MFEPLELPLSGQLAGWFLAAGVVAEPLLRSEGVGLGFVDELLAAAANAAVLPARVPAIASAISPVRTGGCMLVGPFLSAPLQSAAPN